MSRRLTSTAPAPNENAMIRAAMIRAIVDQAPPFSVAQIILLGRIFDGAADRIRARVAQETAAPEAAA